MHPALHRKNTPSLALNKYLKILVFYFYYFLRISFEFFHTIFESMFSKAFFMNEKNSITKR